MSRRRLSTGQPALRPTSRLGRRALLAFAALVALTARTALATPDLAERLDRLVRNGGDAAQTARAQLDALPTPADAAGRRALALARGELLARSGDAGDAAAALGEAVITAAALGAQLAEADGQYLRALAAEREGSSQLPALAASALALYDAHCAAATTAAAAAIPAPALASAPGGPIAQSVQSTQSAQGGPHSAASVPHASPGTTGACEHRPRWRLHQLLSLHALGRRQIDAARRHAADGLALAQAGSDLWRQVGSECMLAQAAAAAQEPAALRRHLDRAEALARRGSDATLAALLAMTEATTQPAPADPRRTRALLNQALAGAQRAGAARLEAVAWGNLSDLALHEGHADEALHAARQGLALAQRVGNQRIGRLLEANAMLARVRLGQAGAARQTLDQLLAAWSAAGDHAAQVAALRQFGDALAATGDLAGALAMHHRERALSRDLHAATREAALADLRGRYDREAEQRRILMLERDNAVKAAALEKRALTQRLWMLGGGALVLALALLLLLARRVRAANQALARNQRQLRHQSERDALTGLINRRHLQTLLQSRRGDEQFQGALLLLDIDHFKQINDRHGHAAGDAVLVALAQRITAVLPTGALAARWGGEEFLVAQPGDVTPEAARALARQLLQAVATRAVPLPDGPALAVTTSIGHARFPLPRQPEPAGGPVPTDAPNAPAALAAPAAPATQDRPAPPDWPGSPDLPGLPGLPLGLARAIHLVDMALYLAKAQGRHRAVGVAATAAPDIEALRLQEADLERAWRDGRLQLVTDHGPATAEPQAPAAPAAASSTAPTAPAAAA